MAGIVCRCLVFLSVLMTTSVGFSQDASESQPQPPVEADTARSIDELVSEALQAVDRLDEARTQEQRDARLEEINQYLDRLEERDTGSPWRSFLLARTYVAVGRPGDAIEQLQEFVRTREGRNEWRAYQMLGDLFVDQFPRLAQGNYEKAAELKPNEPSLLYGMSLAASKIGRSDEALELARGAVEADGRQTIQYLSHLARLLGSQEKWADAEAAARGALELARQELQENPGSRRTIQAADAQYALLVELIQRRLAVIEKPSNDDGDLTHEQLADLYVRFAEYIERRTELAARLSRHTVLQRLEAGVRRMEPDPPPRLLERYAITLAEFGRTRDAIAAFERLRTADPTNKAASQWLERLESDTPAAEPPGSAEDN